MAMGDERYLRLMNTPNLQQNMFGALPGLKQLDQQVISKTRECWRIHRDNIFGG